MRNITLAVGIALLMVAGSTAGASLFVQHVPANASVTWLAGLSNVKHVVILLEENHAYDSMFGTYCQSKGGVCPMVANGIPAGTCIPVKLADPTGKCDRPYAFNAANLTVPHDMSHSYNASHLSYDNGSMDGFVQTETAESLGHYNGTTEPVYWDIAQEFGLGDNFYSSTLSYSLPNHWYLVAGQAPNESENHTFQKVKTGVNPGGTEGNKSLYLNESNNTSSAEDLLAKNSNVTWKWYDQPLGYYGQAIKANGGTGAYSYWNPQAAKAESYTQKFDSHFVARSTFFDDAANGSLPNISWIMPAFNQSDHPPENVTQGQNWIASLVNAVESGPEWSSTAFFISWDDYGGFYDHVAPPQIDGLGLGFRVPLLVVSPWTPVGWVGSGQMDFESLLHFVEVRWNLGCFTTRDCNAHLPTGFFNWNIYRAPVFFEQWSQSTYPYSSPPVGKGQYINQTLARNSVNETTNVFAPDID